MLVPHPETLKKQKELKQEGALFCLARVAASEKLYVGNSDFKVYEVDLAIEKPLFTAFTGSGHESYVTGIALAGTKLVSGSYDGRLIWWDTQKREQQLTVEAHARWIRRVVASPDGKLIASVADDMLCKLWNAETGELVRVLEDHKPTTPHDYPSMLYATTFSPDGRLLATGDKVGHVAIWNVDNGEKLGEVEVPVMYTWDPRQRRHSIGGIRSLAFSPSSETLAVGGIGTIGNIDHLGGPSRIETFDWKAGKRIHEISDNKFPGLIEQMMFHHSGEWLLAVGGDHKGFISFYNAATGKLMHQARAGEHVHAFAVNESFDRIYTVHHKAMMSWELQPMDNSPVEAPKPVSS